MFQSARVELSVTPVRLPGSVLPVSAVISSTLETPGVPVSSVKLPSSSISSVKPPSVSIYVMCGHECRILCVAGLL